MSGSVEGLLQTIEADMDAQVGEQFVRVAAHYLAASRNAERPVAPRAVAAELGGFFDAPLPRSGRPVAEVVADVVRDVVAQSNWLYHPRYMGHQVSAPLPAAVWADVVVSALNQSVAVQEMSPALTMVEHRLIRWLCEAAGFKGPLHECSVYGSAEAGRRFREMMALGASRPWQDALEKLTGTRQMDASAIVEYFQPLMGWLEEQNRGRECGW